MNAREIALSKVKNKKDKEQEAARIYEENKTFRIKEGKKLRQMVEAVVKSFAEDFTITRKTDSKNQSTYGWYIWKLSETSKDVQLYVVLQYETHTGKFSDDTPEQEWSEWYVTVQVPKALYDRKRRSYYDYKGHYDHRLDMTVLEDFSCSSSRIEDEFEKRFGEYMAKWYE